MSDALPRAGDHVLHGPSGETWVVAHADAHDLAWCGWPDGLARTSDCTIVKRCSDAEHVAMLREIASSSGRRGRRAQAELAQLAVSAFVDEEGDAMPERRPKP